MWSVRLLTVNTSLHCAQYRAGITTISMRRLRLTQKVNLGWKFADLLPNTWICPCVRGDKYMYAGYHIYAFYQEWELPFMAMQPKLQFLTCVVVSENFWLDRIPNPVFTLLKFFHPLIFLTRQQNVSPHFPAVRMHSAEQNDPFGRTLPIGWSLSMAELG
mgnify:CR=1 FL=1